MFRDFNSARPPFARRGDETSADALRMYVKRFRGKGFSPEGKLKQIVGNGGRSFGGEGGGGKRFAVCTRTIIHRYRLPARYRHTGRAFELIANF